MYMEYHFDGCLNTFTNAAASSEILLTHIKFLPTSKLFYRVSLVFYGLDFFVVLKNGVDLAFIIGPLHPC